MELKVKLAIEFGWLEEAQQSCGGGKVKVHVSQHDHVGIVYSTGKCLDFFFSFVICIMRVKKHGLTHYYQLKKKARHLVPCLFFGVFDS